MTAWSHVIDLVGRMQAANDRVNAALNVMGLGALPSDECRAIRDGAAAEIEALNSSLAAALAGTGARDTARGRRRAMRGPLPGKLANRPALLRPGRAPRRRMSRRFGCRGAAASS
jgi:hypothetical protein